MNEIDKRLLHIKWLTTNGVKYYCSPSAPNTLKTFEHQIAIMQKNQSYDAPIITHKDKIRNNIFDQNLTNKLLTNSLLKEQAQETYRAKNLSVHEDLSTARKKQSHSEAAFTKEFNDKQNEMNSNDKVLLARKLANEAINLEDLYDKIRNFDGCGLKQFAKNTVLCDGNPDAKIMLVGEAPGATEDEKGISFCGESGMLLDAMLHTIGISRKTNAYITNTVFWRPPANRKPTSEEIELCRPFVEKHIALINPHLIILVGATATSSLLNQGESITNLRGNIYLYKNQYINDPIKTTAIFHPAYLLRQPFKKKDMWYDLLKIKDILTKHNI